MVTINSDKLSIILSYNEILKLFGEYFKSQKNHIYDLRNIRIANIDNHPLQTIFKVRAFHRKQVHALIFKQLIFSKLTDRCAFTISNRVSIKNISKLQIPQCLKILIHSLHRYKSIMDVTNN